MFTGPVPHVGGPILPPGAPTVLINFLPAATVTSMATCVGPPDMIVKGSTGVFIDFLPAARMGDLTAHGGVIVLGSPNVLIGEIGAPSPGAGGLGGIVAGLAAASIGTPQKPDASEYSSPAGGGTFNGGGAGGAAGAGLPTKKPADCKSAPETVIIPKNVNDSMATLMKNSFPGGKSQEQGGIIASDAQGNVSIVNQGSGTSGTFTPNRALPAGSTEVGLFHTHPYDATEGGFTGVSYSGADMGIAADRSEPSYVQSGDTQFLLLPTDKTPTNIGANALNASQNARIAALTKVGTPFDAASRQPQTRPLRSTAWPTTRGKMGRSNVSAAKVALWIQIVCGSLYAMAHPLRTQDFIMDPNVIYRVVEHEPDAKVEFTVSSDGVFDMMVHLEGEGERHGWKTRLSTDTIAAIEKAIQNAAHHARPALPGQFVSLFAISPSGSKEVASWNRAGENSDLASARKSIETLSHSFYYIARACLESGVRTETKTGASAAARFKQGIDALGDSYTAADMIDDTGMKLVLAQSIESKEGAAKAGPVYRRVLESRLSAYAEHHHVR